MHPSQMKPSSRTVTRTAFVEKHVPVIASDSHDILTRERMSSDFDAHIVPVWSSARLSPPRKVARIIQGGQSAMFNRVLSAPLRKSSSSTHVRSVPGQTTSTTEASRQKETVDFKLAKAQLEEIRKQKADVQQQLRGHTAEDTNYGVPASASQLWPKPYHVGYHERYIAQRPGSYHSVQQAVDKLMPQAPTACSRAPYCEGVASGGISRSACTSVTTGLCSCDMRKTLFGRPRHDIDEALASVQALANKYKQADACLRERQLRLVELRSNVERVTEECRLLREKAVTSSYAFAHTAAAMAHKKQLWALLRIKEDEVRVTNRQLELLIDTMAVSDSYLLPTERDAVPSVVELTRSCGDDDADAHAPSTGSVACFVPSAALKPKLMPQLLREQELSELTAREEKLVQLIRQAAAALTVS